MKKPAEGTLITSKEPTEEQKRLREEVNARNQGIQQAAIKPKSGNTFGSGKAD